MSGAAWALQHQQHRGRKGKYIPHPTTGHGWMLPLPPLEPQQTATVGMARRRNTLEAQHAQMRRTGQDDTPGHTHGDADAGGRGAPHRPRAAGGMPSTHVIHRSAENARLAVRSWVHGSDRHIRFVRRRPEARTGFSAECHRRKPSESLADASRPYTRRVRLTSHKTDMEIVSRAGPQS
jgi:hypothetical protein